MLSKGTPAPDFQVRSMSGLSVQLSALRGKQVLLKFHRFSGCPVCQHQTHAYMERAEELRQTGAETLIVIHSSAERMRPIYTDRPGLTFIPDPGKKLYRLYGSGFSFIMMWNIGTWKHIFSAFTNGFFPRFRSFQGGVTGVPSDFLIAPDGTLSVVHYGTDYGDSCTVDEAIIATRALSPA